MTAFTKLDWKITRLNLSKEKKNINFINLIEFPSFTYARYAALSDDCFVHSLTETLRLEVQAIGII